MKSHLHDHADEPPVIASQLVYFFVPLPDPLGLPDKYIVEVPEYAPLDRIRDDGVPPICLGASLRFHTVELPTTYAAEFTVLFDLAVKSLPPNAGARTSASKPGGLAAESGPSAPRTPTTTVVEMAVAAELPDVGQSAPEEELNAQLRDPITEAFDRGLHYVRQFQRAYYLARREPIRLVTREALPFAVPFGIRRLFGDDGEPLPFDVSLSVYLVNMNVPNAGATRWVDSDNRMLSTAVAQQADNGPFTSYMDLVRESNVALSRDGAYRSAVLFTATACEVLFDDLLAHLMWEEGQRPEEAANAFDSQLTARVKSQYHARLGGLWRLDAGGPISDWFILVARLRNRVVHGGYEPTFQEATVAVQATDALREYLGDLIANRALTYPRTALVLPGEGGLVRRGKWTSALNDLRNDTSEVHWRQTFARWQLAMQRARKNSPLSEIPSTTDASIYVVVRTNGSEQWVIHDRRAGMAAVLDGAAGVTGVTPDQWASVRTQIASVAEQSDRTDVSVLLPGAKATAEPLDRWLPEYRLVPLTGVMVTGKDLDPVWT